MSVHNSFLLILEENVSKCLEVLLIFRNFVSKHKKGNSIA